MPRIQISNITNDNADDDRPRFQRTERWIVSRISQRKAYRIKGPRWFCNTVADDAEFFISDPFMEI